MKAARIALVVLEVEAVEGETKEEIAGLLLKILREKSTKEVQIAAMKIFRADEATPAS